MSKFGVLKLEDVVQVDDKTRLDATGSYISKDESALTVVEIEPEAGYGFVTVTGTKAADWFLDWQYSTAGTKTVSVRLTNLVLLVPDVVTFTKDIVVVTSATDYLFSADTDLLAYEDDILKYVKPGRNSWLNYHRRAQETIMKILNDKGYVDTSGDKFTKAALVDLDEVRLWSALITLSLIFENQSNAIDDIFGVKSKTYASKANDAGSKAILRIDVDGDAVIDQGEFLRPSSVSLVRR
jgi:hypothetical protein